jgi:hypothetical protein
MTFLANTHLCSILEELFANPHWGITPATDQHYIRDVDLCLLLDNSSPRLVLRRPRMAFDHVDLFHEQAIFTRKHSENFPTFSAIFARDDLNKVVLFDLERWPYQHFTAPAFQHSLPHLPPASSPLVFLTGLLEQVTQSS